MQVAFKADGYSLAVSCASLSDRGIIGPMVPVIPVSGEKYPMARFLIMVQSVSTSIDVDLRNLHITSPRGEIPFELDSAPLSMPLPSFPYRVLPGKYLPAVIVVPADKTTEIALELNSIVTPPGGLPIPPLHFKRATHSDVTSGP